MRIVPYIQFDGSPAYVERGLTEVHLERAITHELGYVADRAATSAGTIRRLYSYTYRFGKPHHRRLDEVFVMVIYFDFLDRGEIAGVMFAAEGNEEEMERYG